MIDIHKERIITNKLLLDITELWPEFEINKSRDSPMENLVIFINGEEYIIV